MGVLITTIVSDSGYNAHRGLEPRLRSPCTVDYYYYLRNHVEDHSGQFRSAPWDSSKEVHTLP